MALQFPHFTATIGQVCQGGCLEAALAHKPHYFYLDCILDIPIVVWSILHICFLFPQIRLQYHQSKVPLGGGTHKNYKGGYSFSFSNLPLQFCH